MIVNTLGASRFWHVAKVIIAPPWVTEKFKSIVWKFVWKGIKGSLKATSWYVAIIL